MSFPEFGELIDKNSDFPQFGEKIRERGKKEKSARVATQYALGALDAAALPLTLQSEVLSSKQAQQAEFRKNIFEDIERLSEQKMTGVWDEQDERLLQELQNQIKNPNETEQFIQTGKISPSSLIKKGSKELFDYDLEPGGIEEHAAEITGNILSPKNILKGTKKLIDIAPQLATKEGRKALKIDRQWNYLKKASKGNSQKEEILDFAKRQNLTPEEATLLLQSEGKIANLEKVAKKTKRFKNIVGGLKDKLQNSYEELKGLGRRGGYVNEKEASALQKDLGIVLEDINRTYVEGPDTKSARELIEKTVENLNNKIGTVEDLINSRRNLRQGVNWRNLDEGDAIRKRAEQAFTRAIEKKNPNVAERLKETDAAWKKYKIFEKLLEKKPNVYHFHGIPVTGIVGNLAFATVGLLSGGIPGVIKTIAVKELVQRLSTRLLTDPAFQGIGKRILQSIKSGSQKYQKGALTAFLKILEKEDPEEYKEFNDLIVKSNETK